MALFANPGDSIEARKILAFGRKIVQCGPPRRDANTRRLRYNIEVKLGGGARILQAYAPPVARIYPRSHLDVGDELNGDLLEGSCVKKFDRDDILVGGYSGAHSGQRWPMDGDCAVRIVKNWLKTSQIASSTATVPVLPNSGNGLLLA